jgi:hypothetical protein
LLVNLSHHLEHMKIKNWVYSIFQESQILYHEGFKNVLPTPGIEIREGTLEPDIIAWNDTTIIIFENKSGTPDPIEDIKRAKKYLRIPLESFRKFTNFQIQAIEVVLLYFEENLLDNRKLKEELFGNTVMERNLVIWVLDRKVGRIRLIYGNHSNQKLNTLLKAGLPIELLPPSRIFIQRDSPTALLAKEMFMRLLSRSLKERNKEFTLDTAIEIFTDQFFAYSDSEKRNKLRNAIEIGEGLDICKQKSSDEWVLNLTYGNPEEFLEKLDLLLKQEYFESS